jgi:hypothetical protein
MISSNPGKSPPHDSAESEQPLPDLRPVDEFTGRFLHSCPLADGAVLDEFDNEILKCRCYHTDEFLLAQDNRAVMIDAKRTAK